MNWNSGYWIKLLSLLLGLAFVMAMNNQPNVPSKSNDSGEVYYDASVRFSSHGRFELLEGKITAPNSGTRIDEVQSLPLVTRSKQWVKFADKYYNVDREGIYVFSCYGKVQHREGTYPRVLDARPFGANLILFQDDAGVLIESLALLHVHGAAHDNYTLGQGLKQMKVGRLSKTCGPITDFTSELLRSYRYRARNVRCLRMTGGTWTSWDNGHVLLEFHWPKHHKWVLADVDNKCWFMKDDRYLNMADVRDLLDRGEFCDVCPMTPPGEPRIDCSASVAGTFNGDILSGDYARFTRPAYWRVFDVVAHVAPDGNFEFYSQNPEWVKRACGYRARYRPLPSKTEWQKKYYDEENGGAR